MVNWSELLSYSTPKIVKIKDLRLGILHYGFIFIIIVYIAGFTIVGEKRYLRYQVPFGTLRMSLRMGKTKIPVHNLSYCLTNNHSSYNGHQNLPCGYWDDSFVVYPPTEASAMLATSRVNITKQNLSCEIPEIDCGYTSINESAYYVADVEHFTLMIDHTVFAPIVGVEANGLILTGSLVDVDNNVMTLSSPNVMGVPGKLDILELLVLMHAAGLSSLDDQSQLGTNSSMRFDGIVLIVFLTYSNTYTYNLNNLKYTISVRVLAGAEFKSVEPVLSLSGDQRVLYNRHGIRLFFVQQGNLGQFDFQTLLLSLVSGIGLLAISTTLVDIIALYLLPQKNAYKEYKYEETEVFSVRSPLLRKSTNEL